MSASSATNQNGGVSAKRNDYSQHPKGITNFKASVSSLFEKMRKHERELLRSLPVNGASRADFRNHVLSKLGDSITADEKGALVEVFLGDLKSLKLFEAKFSTSFRLQSRGKKIYIVSAKSNAASSSSSSSSESTSSDQQTHQRHGNNLDWQQKERTLSDSSDDELEDEPGIAIVERVVKRKTIPERVSPFRTRSEVPESAYSNPNESKANSIGRHSRAYEKEDVQKMEGDSRSERSDFSCSDKEEEELVDESVVDNKKIQLDFLYNTAFQRINELEKNNLLLWNENDLMEEKLSEQQHDLVFLREQNKRMSLLLSSRDAEIDRLNEKMNKLMASVKENEANQKSEEKMGECGICFNKYKKGEELARCKTCSQRVHKECFKKWENQNASCIFCTARMRHTDN